MTAKLSDLVLRAGPRALAHIREHGLSRADVRVVAGAAGGPKWLILGHLDRFIFGEWLTGRREPLDLVGSSIGAWRFAAACHPDPVACIDRMEAAYLTQEYGDNASPEEVSAVLGGVLNDYLDETAITGIIEHPVFRLHTITVRSRGPTATERKRALAAGSGAAAVANLFSRRLLGRFFERVVFHHPSAQPLRYARENIPTRHVPFTRENLRAAVAASGTIPMLMRAERDIAGAPAGYYFDGGLADYHLDQPLVDDGLVLMPHFDSRMIPGWFDKFVPWRKRARFAERTVLIGPSETFVQQLKGGKIPDRHDFWTYVHRDEERLAAWRHAVAAGERFADAFRTLLDDPDPVRHFSPLLRHERRG